ncbi:hypothetical protein V2J09_014912 [Rumex salicifolius]
MKKRLVRVRTRFRNVCFRISKARIRVRALALQSNPAYNSIPKADRKTNDLYEDVDGDTPRGSEDEGDSPNSVDGKSINGNRILVVIDSTKEAKGALDWALTHTVQKEDTIILLHIAKTKIGGPDSGSKVNPRAYGLLYSMKSICRTKRPGVKIESVMLKGKEKGRMIVEEAKLQKASLLVLGHKRRSMTWNLLMRWTGKQSSSVVADYCIENSECMTIAVRRKSKKLGGYLITTKRHKNFWLLA